MLTVLESKSKAIAEVLAEDNSTWNKSQADKAAAVLVNQLKDGEIDPPTFSQAMIETTGNHSAMLQALVKGGLVIAKPASKSALIVAIEKELATINAALAAEIKG